MISVTKSGVRGGTLRRVLGTALTISLLSFGLIVTPLGQSQQTVVVVPFTNISGQPADDWLGAGIAETVTTDLERVAGLSVTGRRSLLGGNGVFEGAGLVEETVLAAARDAGMSWLVAGGYQRLGDQLRITARIVGVESGNVAQSVKVDGELGQLFDLQDQVVDALTAGFVELLGTLEQTPAVEVAASPAAALTLPAPQPSVTETPPVSADPVESAPRPAGTQGGFVPPGASSVFDARPEVGGAEGEVVEPALPAAGRRRGGPPGSVQAVPEVPMVLVTPNELADPVVVLAQTEVAGTITLGDDAPRLGVASSAGILTGRPNVRPPRTTLTPLVDGHLDDEIWRHAAHITEFVQLSPLDGAPATEESDVYIAYDSANIYIGFHAHFSDPSALRANRKDRDVRTGDDVFWVYFDPFLDQQRAYSFAVNAYGIQIDAIASSRRGGGFGGRGGRGGPRLPFGDMTWDALFESAGQIVPDGFTAEMAIPFKSLRYPQRGPGIPHQWGFQIARRIRAQDETAVWSPVSREVAGFLPQMGVLEGMTDLSTSRNIEILPTFTAVQFGSLDDRGGFVNADAQPEAGVNLKYGVTSNLTADATFNPDFSQIESDRPQIELNQRFALFFPELRPFFLEGAEIFRLRTPVNLVHTRTIVDPEYGAKLTGKTGNTTIGVMFANDAAPGNVDDPEDPAFGQTAQTFVGRVRYDLYSESFVGAIVTNRGFLDSHSRVVGVDAQFRLGNTHELGLNAAGTQHRDLDGIDTTGHLFNAFLRKTGRSLGYLLAHYSVSPDLKTDVGFVRRTDQRWTFTDLNYRWWPEGWLVSWGPRVRYNRSYNYDGIVEDEQTGVGTNFSFARNINLNADVNREVERFAGVNFVKTRYRFFTVVAAFRPASFGIGGRGGDQVFYDEDNPYLGDDIGWNAFVNLRPIPQLESRINIDANRFSDPRNGDDLVFDVNIFRALTTYQFTDRFLLRNISEYNSFDKTLGLNFLFTYRVNAGTVFYVGYDDRYQQADHFEFDPHGDGMLEQPFNSPDFTRTNRAVFTKFQYLFRF